MQLWGCVFVVFGWAIAPAIAGLSFLNGLEMRPNGANLGWRVGLDIGFSVVICFCAWLGYLGWLHGKHRYVFVEGNIISAGRRKLWELSIDDIVSVREYRSGKFVVWYLQTATGEKGLVLYDSLRAQLSGYCRKSQQTPACR